MDPLEQRRDARVGFRLPAGDAMDLQRAPDVVLHAVDGVERGVRVLEDDLDLAPVAQQPTATAPDLLAAEAHHARRGRLKLGEHAADGRLARPALADERHHLARDELERDVLYRVDDLTGPGEIPDPAPAHRVMLGQLAGLQHHGVRLGGRPGGRVHRGPPAVSVPSGSPVPPGGLPACSQQATRCGTSSAGRSGPSFGSSRLQISMACEQRGANGQPGGSMRRSGGETGDADQLAARAGQRRETTSACRRCKDARDPGGNSLARGDLDDPPGIHDRDGVGDLQQQRQVVGYEHRREAEL